MIAGLWHETGIRTKPAIKFMRQRLCCCRVIECEIGFSYSE